MISDQETQNIKTGIILIWWGLMIAFFIWIEYSMFSNPKNNILQAIFISLPIGVMFVGLPLLFLVKDDEDLFWVVFFIGLIIFIIGLCLCSLVGVG
jgi:hypothetical protein